MLIGMLNLVDLAGSERLKKSASEGQRKTEALHINQSLTALGKVRSVEGTAPSCIPIMTVKNDALQGGMQ